MSQIGNYTEIDHLAIAVSSLEESICFYTEKLNFKLKCIREIEGTYTGMRSAELTSAGNFSIVLVESTHPESQVQMFVDKHNYGVQHVAFKVDNIESEREKLIEAGVDFSTDIIEGPGVKQMFTRREETSGMMYEFIQRTEQEGFLEDNIQNLFNQLEENGAY
ncbi:VOC family protein [Pseudoalteromonas luteoviolacea]|uniref:VOC domain-containing protein n=1 Tax=Pseudoalteromonas luteoviolacea S4054 TaxID=1129367 RepID=A0A0F6AC31_9GAMM|nr:VOC family protein [Pseudoalteromonas luteoviolacea]AOT10644.1 glyoxalase [Pseudoalteromonas luteoviolacea]AOT15288.1 glyoxalase [Pseudoalteromonas luteoviolacea]AOT20463.1 glyoxalase [Pseudoalteromonas luteoviolacea]KKE83745.1 hypothetical protein N479_13030 [Pseudoalteromonas luteoviolacea S4054]KZN71949.1 hypothetical protein N481_17395 [Pseudoalteromonas luteoviolacea S4047-1]